MFFIEFIRYYIECSVICLLKDIFFGEFNIITYKLEETVKLYKKSVKKNIETIGNIIPFFVILEINYYYSYDYDYLRGYMQFIFNIYFAYFINILVNLFSKEKNCDDNKLISVFSILNIEPYYLYLNYLVPLSFLTFTLGLNKFAIDLTFYCCLLFFFCKNSNYWNLVLLCETIQSYMKIKEFKNQILIVFNLINEKYTKLSTKEGREILFKKIN